MSFGRFAIAYCNTLLICTAPTSEWKRWWWDRWWPPLNKTQTDKDVKCTICTTGRRYFVLSTLYLVRWQWLTQGQEENGFSDGNRFQFALPPPSVIEVTRWCLRLRLPGSPFINFTTNFIVINITLITLITNITFFYLWYLQVHYKSLEALKVLWCEAQILCDFSGLGLEACFFQTKAQLVEWVIEWLNGLCSSCFNSVTPCLVWSSVGFPHHHQPKLHTNNNWKGTVGCTVWYVNHTHYGLLLGRACGAAYSCVAPSGNPILKRAGVGGSYMTVLQLNIWMKSEELHSAGWLFCFDPSSWPGHRHLLLLGQYFESRRCWWKTWRAPVLTPSPHPVHPVAGRRRAGCHNWREAAKRLPLSFVPQEAASSLPPAMLYYSLRWAVLHSDDAFFEPVNTEERSTLSLIPTVFKARRETLLS